MAEKVCERINYLENVKVVTNTFGNKVSVKDGYSLIIWVFIIACVSVAYAIFGEVGV